MRRRSGLAWTGSPRVKPPFGAAAIDWAHPLARGLEVCVLYNEGGGGPGDLVTRARAAWPVSNWSWTTTRQGRGLACTSTTVAPSIAVADARFLGAITLGQWFRADTGLFTLMDKGAAGIGGGATTPFFCSTAAHPSGNMYFVRSNSAFRTWDSAQDVITLGVPACAVVTAPVAIETAPTLYVNGGVSATMVPGQFPGIGTGAATGGGDPITLGSRDALRTGVISQLMVWSRQLPSMEARWVSVEPFAMLRPRAARAVYSFPPGVYTWLRHRV